MNHWARVLWAGVVWAGVFWLTAPALAGPSRAETTARQVSDTLYQNCRQGAIPFPEMLKGKEGLCACLRETFQGAMLDPESQAVVETGDKREIDAHVQSKTREVLATCVHAAMMEKLLKSCLSGEGMRNVFRQHFVNIAEKQVYCLCARNETGKKVDKDELLTWLYQKREDDFLQQARAVARECGGALITPPRTPDR